MKIDIKFARVTSGELFEYLKDIRLLGKVDDDGDFLVFGCRDEDQDKFYKGLLEYDKAQPFQGWETIDDVKGYWEEGGEMILFVEKGYYELVGGTEDVEH